jgi:hypothetical protein
MAPGRFEASAPIFVLIQATICDAVYYSAMRMEQYRTVQYHSGSVRASDHEFWVYKRIVVLVVSTVICCMSIPASGAFMLATWCMCVRPPPISNIFRGFCS